MALFAIALLLALSAGCLGAGGNEELPDSESVAESMRTVEAIEGNATIAIEVGNETTSMRMQFVERLSTREFRGTVRSASADTRLRMVSNGSTVWVYNQSSNTAQTLRLEGIQTGWNRSIESVSEIFGTLKESSSDDVTISTLPVVPGGAGSAAVGATSMPSLGEVSATYRGTETAAGRQTHVVGVQPTGEGSLIRNGTLWIDAEYYLPIKVEYDMSIGGQPASVTVAYRNLTYNPEIPEGAFTFDPPPTAQVVGSNQSAAVFQDRSALVEEAEQTVPEPSLPDEFAFAQGSIETAGENRSLALQYANGSETLVINKQTVLVDDVDGERVDVAGNEGILRTDDVSTVLLWQCEGNQYAITADLSNETLRSIAESMACE